MVRTVYFGKTDEVVAYFDALGKEYVCPPYFNPAEHVQRLGESGTISWFEYINFLFRPIFFLSFSIVFDVLIYGFVCLNAEIAILKCLDRFRFVGI